MNIEQAIDILKNSIADYVIGEYCKKCVDNKICDDRNEDCYFQQAIDIVVTAYEKEKEERERIGKLYYKANENCIDYEKIIEKQQKEIEELKKPKYLFNSNTGEITRIDNMSDYVSKDKIKAKVIEVKDRTVKDEFITATQSKLNTIIDIESLLERE